MPVIVYDEVVGVHGVAEDVTENNEMRRELERTRRAAEEASAAKSLFLANMSHEVRTPLTSVLGATEMLAEDDLDPHQQYLVDVIHRSGERLLRLVNDILDVSRLEAGKLEVHASPFDVRTLVRDVATWAAPLAEREGLTLACSVDPALPAQVVGDAMRVSQVLTNLLGNALKFTEAGQVRMAVESGPRLGSTHEVCFVVEDSGIGIHGDQLAGLFESFTQVDTSTTRKYGGAGLGLAICQELVDPDGRHPRGAQHAGTRQHVLLHAAATGPPRGWRVARPLLDLLPFGSGGAALLVERGARVLDVPGELVDLLAAHRLLDEGAQDLHLLGLRREGVRRNHPASLRRELPGDVGLVVGGVVPGLEPERHQRELLEVLADHLEATARRAGSLRARARSSASASSRRCSPRARAGRSCSTAPAPSRHPWRSSA